MLLHDERTSLKEWLGERRSLYLLGLALDFSVIDSAITAQEAGGHASVYVVSCTVAHTHVAVTVHAHANVRTW